MRCFVLLSMLCALVWAPAPAFAQESDASARAAARKLGSAGIEAYNAADYPSAADKLDKAYKILKAPSLGLWSARAFVKLGRLLEASERYLEVTRLSTVEGDQRIQEQAKVDARKEYDALTPRISGLVVKLEGATASQVSLSVDGKPLKSELVGESTPMDPGAHKVLGVRGSERVEVSVTLSEGKEGVALLRFDPNVQPTPAAPVAAAGAAPSTSPTPTEPASAAAVDQQQSTSQAKSSPLPVLGWISIGFGGAAIVTGGITGAMAIEKKADLAATGECDHGCRDSGRYQNFQTLRTVSTISFAAGGVLVATGIILLIVAPSKESSTVSLDVGPGHAALSGTF
jgi:hypothetical protein